MKKNLIEELKRIHTITYGENVVNESFMSDLLSKTNKEPEDVKKVDKEKTADYVTNDVTKFLDTLKNIDHLQAGNKVRECAAAGRSLGSLPAGSS